MGLPQEQEGLDLLQGLQILGLVALGRRVRTWERLDIGIVIYAFRPSEAGISRDPSCIKGFFPSDVAVVPNDDRKFFSQPALSLLHPQSIRGLLLSLNCLLQKLCSFLGLAKLFAELLHHLLFCFQIDFAEV